MFQLCEITNQDSLYYNITVEEGETLLKSFFFLGVNMNSHYLYQIAKRNLKDLLEFITQQLIMDFEQLNNTIKNYLDNDKTNSAIMLTGEWGSGKSYYIM